MSGRSDILAKLRAALDEGDANASARAAAARSRIRKQSQDAPIPKLARADGMARVDQFVGQALAAQAQVRRLAAVEDAPSAISEELRARNLPMRLRIGEDPTLKGLDWGAIEISVGAAEGSETATLSWAADALAETGTLVFRSEPATPSTLNFLGETHFAILSARDIHAGFEGLWRKYRDAGYDPRTLNLITGPSRTGDIEQKLELGAHGPIAVHIFLIDDY